MTHNLKIKDEFAQLHFQGKKDWELRINDRDFKTGDLIQFTIVEFGFVYTRTIEAIFNDFGLQKNYVILSLKKH
jgi:ASC-1-like (ASCH) protein